jgi:hypothetical protein
MHYLEALWNFLLYFAYLLFVHFGPGCLMVLGLHRALRANRPWLRNSVLALNLVFLTFVGISLWHSHVFQVEMSKLKPGIPVSAIGVKPYSQTVGPPDALEGQTNFTWDDWWSGARYGAIVNADTELVEDIAFVVHIDGSIPSILVLAAFLLALYMVGHTVEKLWNLYERGDGTSGVA